MFLVRISTFICARRLFFFFFKKENILHKSMFFRNRSSPVHVPFKQKETRHHEPPFQHANPNARRHHYALQLTKSQNAVTKRRPNLNYMSCVRSHQTCQFCLTQRVNRGKKKGFSIVALYRIEPPYCAVLKHFYPIKSSTNSGSITNQVLIKIKRRAYHETVVGMMRGHTRTRPRPSHSEI